MRTPPLFVSLPACLLQDEYLQFCQFLRSTLKNGNITLAFGAQNLTSHMRLNDPDVKGLFHYNPSPQYLESVFLASINLEWVQRYMSSIQGEYLCADHTFRIAKYIRDPTGERIFEAAFTVMNETCQIVGQYMVQTKSWIEVEPAMQALWQRYTDLAKISTAVKVRKRVRTPGVALQAVCQRRTLIVSSCWEVCGVTDVRCPDMRAP